MAYLGKTNIRDMFFGAKPYLFELARHYRKKSTPAESTLWKYLRPFRNEGFIFRRQHPLVFFIADFYCHSIKLVIEVDGGIHSDDQRAEYDDARSGELERYGLTVLRFKNEDVLENIAKVLLQIRLKIRELTSSSPEGEGDKRG